jgi:hypothetical protein
MEDVMMRQSFYQLLSPADRITVAKWTRAVTAFYVSIALVAVTGLAIAHKRSDGTQNQVVNLQPLQVH